MPCLSRLPVMVRVRVSYRIGALLVPLVLAACATATVSALGTVRGTVLSGPRCPGPENPASPCPPGPVDGATVTAVQDGRSVAIAHTDSRGGFQLTLPIGHYVLEATNPGGYRSRATGTVTVTASQPLTVTLLLDTGIR